MKEGWTYKRLDEVGKVITGNTPSTRDKDNYASDDVCFVKPSDIEKTGITSIYETEYHISKTAFERSRKLPKGSVLTTCIGIIGKVGLLEKEATCNQQINAIIPSSNIISSFLAYSLLGIRKQLETMANAPVVPIINKADFSSIKIAVPSIEKQKGIVAELDLLSNILDKQKIQLKQLDNLALSVFYDMFGNPVENEKGWTCKRLDEIGKIVGGSTPSTSDESNWDGEINWITPAELGTQLYYGETQRKITSKAANQLTLMPKGTVLLSSRAPIGKLAISSVPMCCNQGFKNIICGKNISNVFLYYYLLLTMDNIKALGRGATFKEVSKQAISRYNVIVPPIALQETFAKKIAAIETQKETINRSIAESQKLFDYTMDKYFS